ncbi:MAG: Nramp family divalent metal transporter [Sulfolobales archaeon]|nr:Nramp family divalent metal transporter [Sulfolobales archaeon]
MASNFGISDIEVVDKLPTPEEVFRVTKLGLKDMALKVLGPSIIAVGVAIGGGEWLLGPATAVRYGLGMAWIVLVSALLQTIYNVCLVRISMYCGEPPIVYLKRVPPGPKFWTIVLPSIIVAWGSWGLAGIAGSGATALGSIILGRLPTPRDADLVRFLTIVIISVCVLIVLFGSKIERTLELANWFFATFIILTLLLVVAPLTVKAHIIYEAVIGTFNFGYIPPGADMSLITAWWAYTALAAGLNFIFMNWYRDKGYGMGAVVGYIPALIGGKKVTLSPAGKIFKLNDENVNIFKKWMRILKYDQWLIFLPGAILGMYLPSLIAVSLLPRGQQLPPWGVAAHISNEFASIVGGWGYYLIGLIGFIVMLSSALGAYVDSVPRNLTDLLWGSEGVRRWCNWDVRRLYYSLLLIYVSFTLWALYQTQPLILVIIAANAANLVGILVVPAVIYLNYKLPKEIRPKMWENLALITFLALSTYFFLFTLLGQLGIKI